MIEFKVSKKPKIAILLDNQVEVTFTTTKSVIKEIETLGDKELTVSVKEYRQKRTKSQNSYLWVLCDEIGKKINRSKIDIYKDYIKAYGVFEIIPLLNQAVDSFIYKFEKNGIGWFCEDLGESKLNGYTKIVAYFGSSTYNTQEMSRLLDAIITDCKELGISTMTLSEAMLLENEN